MSRELRALAQQTGPLVRSSGDDSLLRYLTSSQPDAKHMCRKSQPYPTQPTKYICRLQHVLAHIAKHECAQMYTWLCTSYIAFVLVRLLLIVRDFLYSFVTVFVKYRKSISSSLTNRIFIFDYLAKTLKIPLQQLGILEKPASKA